VSEDGGAVGCAGAASPAASQQGAEQAAHVKTAARVVVALQRAQQGISALRLGRVLPHRAQHQGQRGRHGLLGLFSAGAQLLRQLLQGGALELRHQVIDKRGRRGHGQSFRGVKTTD
jgi:hypothetical protein